MSNYDPRVLNELDILEKEIHDRLPEIIGELKQLYIEKNTGYAGKSEDSHANLKLGEDVRVNGVQYCYTRTKDKMKRLSNLINDALDGKEVVKDGKDGIEEEFRDKAVYDVLGLIMRREWVDNAKDNRS